jgi:hypothetical protein
MVVGCAHAFPQLRSVGRKKAGHRQTHGKGVTLRRRVLLLSFIKMKASSFPFDELYRLRENACPAKAKSFRRAVGALYSRAKQGGSPAHIDLREAMDRSISPLLARKMLVVKQASTSGASGLGLFAAVSIAKGKHIIAPKADALIDIETQPDAARPYSWEPASSATAPGPGIVLSQFDTTFCNEARNINSPNPGQTANAEAWWYRGGRVMFIVAARDIARGEQITVDYSWDSPNPKINKRKRKVRRCLKV